MLVSGIIQPSVSPYNSPLWIFSKKTDSRGNKKWTIVIAYRALNEKKVADAYALPNITDILDQLGGAKYFSVMDLASGFHQIPMDPDSQEKTAFSTAYARLEFTRTLFGLKNAPANFQRVMNQVLSGVLVIELFVYMDDIVVHANPPEFEEASLPVTLADGHVLKFANSYLARLSSKQNEENADSYETDEYVREILGRIFLSEGDSSVEANGKKGNDDFTFERRGNDDFALGRATQGQDRQVNAHMSVNSAGCRRQEPHN